MEQKLIKLSETHYIIVDDSEIKEGDWYITSLGNIYQEAKRLFEEDEGLPRFTYPQYKKITHSTDINTNEVYYITLSEVEEAINGYSVEKMAEKFVIDKLKMSSQAAGVMIGYIEGFKAHQELSKSKIFTQLDMYKALSNFAIWISQNNNKDFTDKTDYAKSIIQSLTAPKTEWDIEFNEQGKLQIK